MKIIWKVVIVLVIIVPIFYCYKTLQTVWEDPEDYTSSGESQNDDNDDIYKSDSGEAINKNESGEKTSSGENLVYNSELGAGVEYDVTGLKQISKVYENAEVSISVANVYKEHNENSEVVGKLEKGSRITVQNYDNGWSTVTNYTLSGWMKTSNIKLPDEGVNMTINPDGGDIKQGTVKVDDALNVRESASTTAKVLTTLNNGTTVTILEENDGWYKIKWSTITGWVKADYITVN